MKRIIINTAAILVIIFGFMALKAPNQVTVSELFVARACCGPTPNTCCGDVCRYSGGNCEAKDCRSLRIYLVAVLWISSGALLLNL